MHCPHNSLFTFFCRMTVNHVLSQPPSPILFFLTIRIYFPLHKSGNRIWGRIPFFVYSPILLKCKSSNLIRVRHYTILSPHPTGWMHSRRKICPRTRAREGSKFLENKRNPLRRGTHYCFGPHRLYKILKSDAQSARALNCGGGI